MPNEPQILNHKEFEKIISAINKFIIYKIFVEIILIFVIYLMRNFQKQKIKQIFYDKNLKQSQTNAH